MAIKLAKETEARLIASIKKYAKENLDEEIGDLKAALLLDFCLREIGPSIYNQAIADAEAFLQERLTDLETVCHQTEFGYSMDSGDPKREGANDKT